MSEHEEHYETMNKILAQFYMTVNSIKLYHPTETELVMDDIRQNGNYNEEGCEAGDLDHD